MNSVAYVANSVVLSYATFFKTNGTAVVDCKTLPSGKHKKKTTPYQIDHSERSDKPPLSRGGLEGLYILVAANSRLFKVPSGTPSVGWC